MVRLVLVGDVSEEDAARIIRAAGKVGFRVRRLDESGLQRLPALPNLSAPLIKVFTGDEPWALGRTADFCAVTGVEQIGDLAAITTQNFLAAHPEGLTWEFEFALLEHMLAQGLDFADAQLKDWLIGPIEKKGPFGPRIANKLIDEGITWVRMLSFLSELDVRDIHQLGPAAVDQIKVVLASYGLTLAKE